MPETFSDLRVPVLIVGGGPVGLSASLFLARFGVRSLLVERRAGTSIHPRARGLNVRTMEIYRGHGLEQAIREAGAALAASRYMLFVETLAGKEIRRVPDDDLVLVGEELAKITPCTWCQCAQDELEPLLLAALEKQGATVSFAESALAPFAAEAGSGVLFGVELLSFTQSEAGVTAIVRERAGGRERTIQADYLLAADGSGSPVRHLLGMPMHGQGTLEHFVNIYIRADLRELVRDRWFGICFVENQHMQGIFLAVNNSDRWLLNVPYVPEQGASAADFTAERCIELVRQAVGLSDLPVEILSVLPWEATARVVEHLRVGRVFLAGDAAHLMPPAGGFGLNTGVQDVHNLAWKLAAVLHGQADPSLLASYEAERLPVAHLIVDQAVSEMNAPTPDTPGRPEQGGPPDHGEGSFLDQMIPVLGYHYASQAVIPDDESEDGSLESGLDLSGRPGTRAPHVWLERAGERISTLDLFGTSFVLFVGAGEQGDAWAAAVREVTDRLRLPLDIYRIGPQGDLVDPAHDWQTNYGVTAHGAILVRPDGFVAWRATKHKAAPKATLEQAFASIAAPRLA